MSLIIQEHSSAYPVEKQIMNTFKQLKGCDQYQYKKPSIIKERSSLDLSEGAWYHFTHGSEQAFAYLL